MFVTSLLGKISSVPLYDLKWENCLHMPATNEITSLSFPSILFIELLCATPLSLSLPHLLLELDNWGTLGNFPSVGTEANVSVVKEGSTGMAILFRVYPLKTL
jgi:hypothetical protein